MMNSIPLISIIIPAYNAEMYLRRCLDSIAAQTKKDFECILVDDGSTDESGVILDEYAKRDNRFIVFHKENGGVSSARNMGLDNAKGKWITFVDADDLIFPNFSEINIPDLSEDLVCFSYWTLSPSNVKLINELNEHGGTYPEGKLFYERNLHRSLFKAPWAKLYKRQLIGENRFDRNIRVGEDNLFILRYLKEVNTLRYIKDFPFYCYYEPSINLFTKYQMTISNSIYVLQKVFEAYWNLNCHNRLFETQVFFDYKCLCQKEIYKSPTNWFKDPRVRYIYNKIKYQYPISFRIKYFLISISFVNYIHNKLSNEQYRKAINFHHYTGL